MLRMKESELISKKWCEMLFVYYEKRFGAYILRTQTGFRYTCALVSVFLLSLLFALLALSIWVFHQNQPITPMRTISTITRMEGVKLKEARMQPKAVEKVVSNGEIAEHQKEMKTSGESNSDIVFKPDINLPDIDIEKEFPITEEEIIHDDINLEVAKALEQTDGTIVDSIPHYPTGLRDFMRWLDKNVVYPPACIRRHIEGTVEVAFIVESDGKITDMRILKKANEMLNHEAIRVMQCMPDWIPAQKHGKPIRAQVTLPIVFEIND